MNRLRTICETIHLAALGLWAGTIVTTGVVAAIAFPTMKALDPALPGYDAYTGEHWMIAAGRVMNRAFHATDAIGLACAAVAGVTLAILLLVVRIRFARPTTVLRTIAVVIAIALGVGSVALLRPPMDEHAQAYWAAARAGDNNEAEHHRAEFETLHPNATFTLIAQLVMVAWALGAGVPSALSEPGRAVKEPA